MGGRGRSNAMQNGQDSFNPLYNAEKARQAEHERQRAKHLKELRARHQQNIGSDKPKMSDQELVNMEQQDKSFANKLKLEDQNEANLSNEVMDEVVKEQEKKNLAKKKVNLDL